MASPSTQPKPQTQDASNQQPRARPQAQSRFGPLTDPSLDNQDATVKDALYFKYPPRNGETSSKKADDLLLAYQTTRDLLVQCHGHVEKFEPLEPEKHPDFDKRVNLGIIQSKDAPLHVVASLVIYTSETAISERVEKAVSEKGFGLVFQKCGIRVKERPGSEDGEGKSSGAWNPISFNKYVIFVQAGFPTSKVENIVETAKGLLELAESIPKMLRENLFVRAVTEKSSGNVAAMCGSLPSALDRAPAEASEKTPIDMAVSAIRDLLKTLSDPRTHGSDPQSKKAAYEKIVSFASQIQQGSKPPEDFWKSVLDSLNKE